MSVNQDLTILQGASANWQSMYATVSASSGLWLQTLSYDENIFNLSLSNSNTISLSVLSSLKGQYLPLTGDILTGPVTARDIFVIDNTKGIILYTLDNHRFRITVNDDGALVTTLLN